MSQELDGQRLCFLVTRLTNDVYMLRDALVEVQGQLKAAQDELAKLKDTPEP